MQRPASLLSVAFLCLTLATAALADCSITGPYTIECDGVTYRAVEDECVFYVDLAAHTAAHPGVPLPDLKKTVGDNYASAPTPVVVELTDYVDCTLTDHNFHDENKWPESPQPNQPSRLMTISGKTFRVTAAPDDGFATFYYSYDVSAGGTAGVPHLLVAESSNDQERYTSLAIHHADGISVEYSLPWMYPYSSEPTINPWGDPWYDVNGNYTQQGPCFGPGVGLCTYTGRELVVDDEPFNIPLVFFPKTQTVRVVVSSLGCNLTRYSTDGGAVSQMWVFEFADELSDGFPAHTPPADPAQERRIGIHMTHPWYFYCHYGTPVRLLSQRQAGLALMVKQFKFCGFNHIVFNAINGSDRTGKTWYPGGAHFDWNAAGDLLSELPPIAEAEGVGLVPVITSLKHPTYTAGLPIGGDSYQLGTDGNYTKAFGNETMDPLRPEVQQLVFNLLGEIATRCAGSPAVVGIGIRANGKIGTCYTADEDGTRGAKLSGYSSWDLSQFKADTGSAVPTSPPGTAYDWLQARPAEWDAWIDWRCERTRDFWLACRDVIKSYRSDLVFYVQADLPSEVPGTNIEWPGETPHELLRHHGYDPDLFASDTGIIISRGMMVAQDRFYVRTRWLPPYGSNHDNYRLFHYAPGLAEIYRTAEGRAAEMYQAYWEETYNPYVEYGWEPWGFRTNTPAAPGRDFFAGPIMSLRRQDPDTMTWLGWERPTLGHEAYLRKFAVAFRALPAVDPVPFDGTVDPSLAEVVARWHGDRLAVINDTSVARTITLHFADALPLGDSLVDVVTGEALISSEAVERQHVSFDAEAYGLSTFLHTESSGPAANFTTDPLPTDPPLTVQFHDASTAENITDWAWDFGDTGGGSGPNPSHTYAAFDTYSVTLTIQADGGPYEVTKPVTLTPVPPTVSAESPPRGSGVNSLSSVSVTFSEAVTGVAAGDLTVSGSAATSVAGSGAGPYLFDGFTQPGEGAVSVVLAPGSTADLGGTPFAGDAWAYEVLPPPVPGLANPSFEDAGGSYNGWEIVHIYGEGPDDPPWDNGNPFGPWTPFGDHFGGKITSGLSMDFYLGQVVGVSDWCLGGNLVAYDLSGWVQLRSTHEDNPNPTGVHSVWEIGWNADGSEPASVMSCDYYRTVIDVDGNYTGNSLEDFFEVTASGLISDVPGLRAVALRVHLYNDNGWWWTFGNIDNVSLVATSLSYAETDPGFYEVGWNMTSVPVEPLEPSASAVFDELVALGNVLDGSLYRYAPGAGYELYPGHFVDLSAGLGYWLRLTDALPGTVVSVVGACPQSGEAVSLANGWTLVGHPLPAAVPLSSVRVTDGGTTLSWADAVAGGWVDATAYYYEGGAYRTLRASGGDDAACRPWRAYWVLAYAGGLSLVLP